MISQVNERHSVPLFASNDSVAGSHIRKINLQKNGDVYINKHMREFITAPVDQRNLDFLNISQWDSSVSYYFISLTFRFGINDNNSHIIDETLERFCCHLDRLIYRKQARKGKRLFIRFGVHETGGKYHIHGILKKPTGIEIKPSKVRDLVSESWRKLNATGNANLLGKLWFQKIESGTENSVMTYMLKDFRRIGMLPSVNCSR